MKTTLSTLDSLLGPQASPSAPGPASSSSTSSAAGSSNRSSGSGRPAAPSWPLPGAAPSSRPAATARKPAGLTFDQVMGFSGVAPEVVNGRAAMLGFLAAISAELRSGESVFAQLVSGGAGQALLVILAVTVASFAPAIRGTPLDVVFNRPRDPKARPAEWGPFTAAAEGLNGRLAMLGLALLLFFEGAGSSAFFL